MSDVGGVSLAAFARQSGISPRVALKLARSGRIIGARKHVLTGKWWIYPPVRLVPGRWW